MTVDLSVDQAHLLNLALWHSNDIADIAIDLEVAPHLLRANPDLHPLV